MQNSNLRLDTYFVERLSWEIAPQPDEIEGAESENARAENAQGEGAATPGWESVLDCADIRCEIERAELDSPRRAAYRLKLDYAAHPTKSPYAWSVALIGYFELDAGFPSEQVLAFMDAGAPAMLYGAAREALAAALGRGPYLAPLLPTVHFANLQSAPPPESAPPTETGDKPKPKRRRKKTAQGAETEASE